MCFYGALRPNSFYIWLKWHPSQDRLKIDNLCHVFVCGSSERVYLSQSIVNTSNSLATMTASMQIQALQTELAALRVDVVNLQTQTHSGLIRVEAKADASTAATDQIQVNLE